MKKLLCATIASLLALVPIASAPSAAVAQQPAAAPVPKLPAMPSLEQKGSDDMTKPAGTSPAKAAKPAPETKRAGKDAKKHEPEPAVTAKAPALPPKRAPAKHEKAPAKPPKAAAAAKAPGGKRKATSKPATAEPAAAKSAAAKHAAKAPKPMSGRTSKRRK